MLWPKTTLPCAGVYPEGVLRTTAVKYSMDDLTDSFAHLRFVNPTHSHLLYQISTSFTAATTASPSSTPSTGNLNPPMRCGEH